MLPSTESNSMFDKYIVYKDHSAVKIGRIGGKRCIKHLSPKQFQPLLDSDYFHGSIGMTQDTKSSTLKHKIIRTAQAVFSTSANDPTFCHAFIIVDKGREPSDKVHSFTIAHAVHEGIILENSSLDDENATEFVIYRPKQDDTRDLLKTNVLSSAFDKSGPRDVRSPGKKAPYSYSDLLQVPFFGTLAEKAEVVEWASSLLADFLLQKQITDDSGNPKGMICSSFVSSILQGALFMRSLKGLKTSEILEFIQKNCGEKPDKSQLSKKIKTILLQEKKPSGTVEKILWNAFKNARFKRYNTRCVSAMKLASQLDQLI